MVSTYDNYTINKYYPSHTDGIRKMRSLLLFHDIVVCAKQKLSRNHVKLEYKWYLPLAQLQFHPYSSSEGKGVGLNSAVMMLL